MGLYEYSAASPPHTRNMSHSIAFLRKTQKRVNPGSTSVDASRATSTDIAALRSGEFELIDPRGGHTHWLPPNWQSIPKLYLREVTKRWPNGERLMFLRSIIFKGAEQTRDDFVSKAENEALFSALALGVLVDETHVRADFASPGGFCAIGYATNCNLQAHASAIGVILSLLIITWCMAGVAFLRNLTPDSIFYQTEHNFNILVAPSALLSFMFTCLGFAMTNRLGLQWWQYTMDPEDDSQILTLEAVLLSPVFVAMMVWALLSFIVPAWLGSRCIPEFKMRDLDPSGKGFSDDFLQAVGVLDHREPAGDEVGSRQ